MDVWDLVPRGAFKIGMYIKNQAETMNSKSSEYSVNNGKDQSWLQKGGRKGQLLSH